MMAGIVASARYAAPTPPGDPYFASVTALLHFDGPNGSTTITDVKGNSWSASAVSLSTSAPLYGSASLSIPNVQGYVESLSGAWSSIGTGDFTIEWTQKLNSLAATIIIIDCRPLDTPGIYPVCYVLATGSIAYFVDGAARITSAAGAIVTGSEQHIAVSRVSGITRMFVNGTQVGADWTDASNYPSNKFRFGRSAYTAGAATDGKFDELRVTKAGRYAAGFSVPARPFLDS